MGIDQGIDIIIIIFHSINTKGGSGATECSGTTNFDGKLFKKGTSSNEIKWPASGKCDHDISAGTEADILNLFSDNNRADWSPILMLAISLGTVYAFYPSIAPYSIIDYQYASVIELWILVISAIPPLVMAILDLATVIHHTIGPTSTDAYGPSGKEVVIELIPGDKIEVNSTNRHLNFSGQTIKLTDIMVTHQNIWYSTSI